MKRELEQRITKRWPAWFKAAGNRSETLMGLGFEHGDGWFGLVWRLCEGLEPFVASAERKAGRPFEVLQVKEKFGGLRFYTNFVGDTISALIDAAAFESTKTCEVCGMSNSRQRGSWITTRCDQHADASRTRSLFGATRRRQ